MDTRKGTKRKRSFNWANGFTLHALRKDPSKRLKSAEGTPTETAWNKTPLAGPILQESPFEGTDLNPTFHQVVPMRPWESTRRYRVFQFDGLKVKIGDNVYVKPDADQEGGTGAPVQGWVAKVLEIRAAPTRGEPGPEHAKPEHIYLRVCWYYRPEDLDGGRQPYHGDLELIASNDMAIINIETVDDKADVIHWQDDDDQSEELDDDRLFWRQTLDVTQTPPALSSLPTHCIDRAPANPDQLLIHCDSCPTWLHGPCLEKAALREVYESNGIPYRDDRAQFANTVSKKKGALPNPLAAKITTAASGKTSVTITDRREKLNTKEWDMPIKCLLCNAIIDAEEDDDDGQDSNSSSPSIFNSPSSRLPPIPATGPLAYEAADEDDEALVGAATRNAPKPSAPPAKLVPKKEKATHDAGAGKTPAASSSAS
ncbi:hypothetical protein K458DRAFT_117615 [Lentithecium fluviatile CBS 122367]|uniref:BAH domain-containing protein n=1 Tax=Lentithecium fluviatile CBS 122367 TaxID=1168545 RepID=A0A6G1IM19_9PLEO|nr:hypothetical protein K458DRAFT_117615 [Lentithecium fluviatile CBS 122367]